MFLFLCAFVFPQFRLETLRRHENPSCLLSSPAAGFGNVIYCSVCNMNQAKMCHYST